MNIQNPLNNQLWASAQLSTNATASQFEQAIKGFHSLVWGAPISVTKEMYDVNGTVTTNQLSAVKNVFTIYVHRSIPQPSTNYVNFQKISTKSQLQYKLPRDTVLSSAPLKGSFIIKCALPDGTVVPTEEIGARNETWRIRDKINAACPNFKEKYDIWDGGKYGYYEDGRELYFRFIGLNYDIPQFIIESFDTNPLTGSNVTVDASTPIPYNSKRIFYEPVPFDFLYTHETSPQILVKVDGLDAICQPLNCSFNYIYPEGAVTGFTLSGTTLTVTGVSLPVGSDLKTITLGNQ